MFYYLYQITNNLNGKIYVGVHKTNNINDGYMGSGKVIQSALKKYEIENFTKVILETFEDSKSMYAREKEVVTKQFLSRDDVYNIRRGGFGGFDYINVTGKNLYGKNGQLGYGGENLHNSVTKDRLIKQDRYNDYLLKISATMKEGYRSGRLKPTFKGRTHSEETLTKLKGHIRQIGKLNSQFSTCWISHELVGSKKCSNELLPEYIEQGWIKGRNIFKR